MTKTPEYVRATYTGDDARDFPSLGRRVEPGDTLTIPASLADEMSDLWRITKAEADGTEPPRTAADKAETRS